MVCAQYAWHGVPCLLIMCYVMPCICMAMSWDFTATLSLDPTMPSLASFCLEKKVNLLEIAICNLISYFICGSLTLFLLTVTLRYVTRLRKLTTSQQLPVCNCFSNDFDLRWLGYFSCGDLSVQLFWASNFCVRRKLCHHFYMKNWSVFIDTYYFFLSFAFAC